MYLKSHKELKVWKKSMNLVLEIYKTTKYFPKSELYGLSSQMRRAAVSVPSNIAEGYTRKSRSEYLQFLRISFSSSAELETQMFIAKKLYSDLDYEKIEMLLLEVQKMLNVLIRKLENK